MTLRPRDDDDDIDAKVMECLSDLSILCVLFSASFIGALSFLFSKEKLPFVAPLALVSPRLAHGGVIWVNRGQNYFVLNDLLVR